MLYLTILGTYFIATILLHKTAKVRLWESDKERRVVLGWFVIIFLTGSACDLFATYKQIWIFPGNGIIGVRFFWLPVEEFLFFIIIPYFVLVTYKILNKVFNS